MINLYILHVMPLLCGDKERVIPTSSSEDAVHRDMVVAWGIACLSIHLYMCTCPIPLIRSRPPLPLQQGCCSEYINKIKKIEEVIGGKKGCRDFFFSSVPQICAWT